MPIFSLAARPAAALRGLGQWIGEAVIGLIPLIVYELVHRFSNLPLAATCPPQAITPNQPLVNCTPVIETASQEICILAVVISGLAVLSIVPLSQEHQRTTIWTRLLILLAVLALMVGSLFYGLFTAHLERDADVMVYFALAVALVSSLCLSIERAIMAA
jgi:hypothetical protein